jgi:hypothetical protein
MIQAILGKTLLGTESARQTYPTSFVTSKDDTTIGYRQMGAGLGLILLHGGASASQKHMWLGTMLSDAFTIYNPDRPGRGLSGPFGDSSLSPWHTIFESAKSDGGKKEVLTKGLLITNYLETICPPK